MSLSTVHNLQKLCINNVIRSNIQVFHKKVLCSIAMTFQANADRFNGVTVISEDENNVENFNDKLEESLKLWSQENKRAVWFKVNLKQADWIPILAKNGFKYHHAQTEYVMMYKWLPKHEENNIPAYAHTMLGVGAVVVNDKKEVLVVKEKYNQITPWKLPGGYVEPGENLADAAMREVFEETNIQTEFSSVLCSRHAHGGQFGCSDLYTVVCLEPITTNIQKDNREILECKWMPISDYLSHPKIHDLNKFFVKKYLDNKNDQIKIDCNHGIHQILKKPYTIYHSVVFKETNNKL